MLRHFGLYWGMFACKTLAKCDGQAFIWSYFRGLHVVDCAVFATIRT